MENVISQDPRSIISSPAPATPAPTLPRTHPPQNSTPLLRLLKLPWSCPIHCHPTRKTAHPRVLCDSVSPCYDEVPPPQPHCMEGPTSTCSICLPHQEGLRPFPPHPYGKWGLTSLCVHRQRGRKGWWQEGEPPFPWTLCQSLGAKIL